MLGNHKDNYKQRNENQINVSEKLFEDLCEINKLKITKLGFDEKTGSINYFYTLHPIIRKLPDYIMEYKNKLHYVEVKGTNKIKVDDINTYTEFYKLFCKNNPLHIAIVNIGEADVKFKNFNTIKKLIKNLPIKRFKNDNKMYYEIPV